MSPAKASRAVGVEEPIREPPGTVPFLRSLRSKMRLSPSPKRFSDRLEVRQKSDKAFRNARPRARC